MGASLSSDIYQYKVDGHLNGIKNCMAIADDIIMYGFKEDGSNHDNTVRKVLEKQDLLACNLIIPNVSLSRSKLSSLG